MRFSVYENGSGNRRKMWKTVTLLIVLLYLDGPVPSTRKIGQEPQQNAAISAQRSEDPKTTSPPPVAVLNKENTPNSDQKPTDVSQNKNEETTINRRLVLFNGILAIVAVLQFFVLIWQVGTTRSSARKELRAYVGISKIRVNLSDPLAPVGEVEIQNFGKTPAYNVRHWVGIAPSAYPLKTALPVPPPQGQGSLNVSPPGVPHSSIVPLKKPLPQGTVIGPSGIAIYVFGQITYQDVFGKERRSTFRYFHGGPHAPIRTKDMHGREFGVMIPDTEGNEAS